jgi:hypothetical protein
MYPHFSETGEVSGRPFQGRAGLKDALTWGIVRKDGLDSRKVFLDNVGVGRARRKPSAVERQAVAAVAAAVDEVQGHEHEWVGEPGRRWCDDCEVVEVVDVEVVPAVPVVTPVDRLVQRMTALAEARARLDVEVAAAVRQARAAGLTWEDFGQAFGISRQAAHQRWGRFDAPPTS